MAKIATIHNPTQSKCKDCPKLNLCIQSSNISIYTPHLFSNKFGQFLFATEHTRKTRGIKLVDIN